MSNFLSMLYKGIFRAQKDKVARKVPGMLKYPRNEEEKEEKEAEGRGKKGKKGREEGGKGRG